MAAAKPGTEACDVSERRSVSGLIIDLNADMGEFAEALANGTDRELMQFITSANIACGGHAGDDETMRKTVGLAKEFNIAVGAHPSYADRANFGRVELAITPREIEKSVHGQILALAGVVEAAGVPLKHVKPHGALYHAANRSREVALAIGRAVMSVDSELVMVGQAGAHALEDWRSLGLRAAGEAFADRAYERDGRLRSRKLAEALIAEPEQAARQAVDIAMHDVVILGDGGEVPIVAETICIHSDTPGARAIARAVRHALKAAGVRVQALQPTDAGRRA
jgi:5-oxoprolinase (ATP-hydrolysing) subunit A